MLNNVFMISDCDGTMLTDDKRVTERNLRAVAELEQAGGQFVIATGRGVQMAVPVIDTLNYRRPAIVFNGACLYDYGKGAFIWKSYVPDKSRELVCTILAAFPEASSEVLVENDVYCINPNDVELRHIKDGNVKAIFCGTDELPAEKWIKALFVGEEKLIDDIVEFVADNDFDDVTWVRSDRHFFELLPKGANKGGAFRRLVAMCGAEDRFTVAVGDYNNDVEMIEYADLGIAVANALPNVKSSANLVLHSDNNSDALYEVVEYLKTHDTTVKRRYFSKV